MYLYINVCVCQTDFFYSVILIFVCILLIFQTLFYSHLVESTSLSPGKVFSVAAIFQVMCYPFYFLCVIYTSCLSAKNSSKQLTSFLQSTQICQHPSAYFTKCPQMSNSPTEVRRTSLKMQTHTDMHNFIQTHNCTNIFTPSHKHIHPHIQKPTHKPKDAHSHMHNHIQTHNHTKIYTLLLAQTYTPPHRNIYTQT